MFSVTSLKFCKDNEFVCAESLQTQLVLEYLGRLNPSTLLMCTGIQGALLCARAACLCECDMI